MPSKRRRRKRRSIRPEAALWGLVIVQLAAGLAFSPLTAVRKVQIAGATTSDHQRITSVLQKLKDVPVMRLNGSSVESALMASNAVEKATFVPNIFGRAAVKMINRTPVARVGDSSVCLDRYGTTFVPDQLLETLMKVDPPQRSLLVNAGLCGPWEATKVAHLCELLKAQVPNVQGTVEVGDRGVLSFQVESGAEVVLGSSESLPQKIEKLGALLQEKPDLLKSVRQLNLTLPSSPVVVRG